MPELKSDDKTSLSIMGGDDTNASQTNVASVNSALNNKKFWVGVGVFSGLIVFVILVIMLMRSPDSTGNFKAIKYPNPNPAMHLHKERYLDKLPKNRKYGINERTINKFLNAPADREFDRVTIDNGSVVSSDSSTGYDLVSGNVEQSVIDGHRDWANNSVIASAGANSKLMVNDHKTSLNTRIGIWSLMTQAQNTYTDEGARVVNSEYPDQIDDVYSGALVKSIGNHISGGASVASLQQ